MASDIELAWEWPHERQATHKVAVKVDRIEAYNSGFLGPGKSPSIAPGVPNPMKLNGLVVYGDASLLGRHINLILPKMELHQVEKHDLVAVGVWDQGICICLQPIPATEHAVDEWLARWQCKPNEAAR